ncbi:hypothetical protein F3J16_25400 [Burkholderia sp. Ap-962]|uniref:hypothetical protein n=1 Tax=Burkholderia sp. Ap-962 TaxID=2608333 RepID=UPI001423665B|nr:hypothetical protein [Burkholderia sp. Ap-962]NIF73493.1 hypothetical protein [Burkholderia sp. Ap-962]
MPFAAFKADRATVLYRSHDCALTDQELIDEYAFSITGNGKGAVAKVFSADRYGGSGMGEHGGSGRCGYDGRFQVKGIGATPLVGGMSGEHHADGSLSFEFAYFELFWGNLLGQILPAGCVQNLALLGISGDGDALRQESYLLIREAAVRPAHFERAIYFAPLRDAAMHRAADVRRVRELARRIGDFLPTIDGASPPADDLLASGLSKLATRVADQLACLRSQFLLHGLSSSNLAIDGRLIDFTSVTSLHPQAAYADAPFEAAWARLWSEDRIFEQCLRSICFYIAKYDPARRAGIADVEQYVLAEFRMAFSRALARYALCFAGIPLPIACSMERDPVVIGWARTLFELIEAFHADSLRNAVRLARLGAGEFDFLGWTFDRFVHGGQPGASARHEMPDQEFANGRHRDVYLLARYRAARNGLDARALDRLIALNSAKFATVKMGFDFDTLRMHAADLGRHMDGTTDPHCLGESLDALQRIALPRFLYDDSVHRSTLSIAFGEARYDAAAHRVKWHGELLDPADFPALVERQAGAADARFPAAHSGAFWQRFLTI